MCALSFSSLRANTTSSIDTRCDNAAATPPWLLLVVLVLVLLVMAVGAWGVWGVWGWAAAARTRWSKSAANLVRRRSAARLQTRSACRTSPLYAATCRAESESASGSNSPATSPSRDVTIVSTWRVVEPP
jgi:hypothetical protein